MQIARCIIFDDDPAELSTRHRLAERALGQLVRREHLELDEVVPASTRTAVLEAVAASPSSIVVADMHGRDAYEGNVGARILRALAQSPEKSARTRRILWTRHDHPEIAGSMAPYVHALAHHRPCDVCLRDARRGLPGFDYGNGL